MKEDRLSEIILANPRGFCAGVDRAISIVERALQMYGAPIYVKHEIVHNPHVVNRLRDLGAVFIECLDAVPRGARLIFSAHGVSPAVRKEAEERDLKVLDATCPLVTKVHKEALRYAEKGFQIIMIGHPKHVEVIGTVGHASDRITLVSQVEDVQRLLFSPDDNLAFITQTTLSLDDTREIIEALKAKYPKIKSPSKNDICYATTNRQNAVKELSKTVGVLLVIGSPNSSNTQRLVEVAQKENIQAWLIESRKDIDFKAMESYSAIGITAGASAPENIVQDVIQAIQENRPSQVKELKIIQENTTFSLPAVLR